MESVVAIKIAKSLLELGQEIAKVIKVAQASPDVVKRVLLYLQVAQAAVEGLGSERQKILTDARRCNVSDSEDVDALWIRLDRYLHEDNIRPQLESSISGLRICRDVIENKSEGAWWRKEDKEAAVKAFTTTLDELDLVLQGLTSNFYPGGSGMGVQTLVPIFEFIGKARGDTKPGESQNVKIAQAELGELILNALKDDSHEEWFRTAGKVEALVTQLQLAFSLQKIESMAENH